MRSGNYPAYFKGGKSMCREYVDTVANEIALALAVAKPIPLTKHQLRAFFGHLKKQEAALKHGLDAAAVICEVAAMKAHAYTRLGRDKIPRDFVTFIERNVDAIHDEADLRAFVKHFEAVTAFCEGRLNKEH